MLLIRLGEVALIAVLVWCTCTQIALPLWYDRPYWPMFRRKQSAVLDRDLRDARQDLDDARIRASIATVRRHTERVAGIEEDRAAAQSDLDDAIASGNVDATRRHAARVRGVDVRLAEAQADLVVAEREVEAKGVETSAKQTRAAL